MSSSSDSKLLEDYIQYLFTPASVDSFEYVMFLAFNLAVMGYCLYKMFRSLKQERLIKDTPTSKIRSAAQGYVELIGHQDQLNELLSPLSKTSCTWWRYEIEKYVSNGKNSYWKTIEKKISMHPFILFDEHGECIVHPEKAEVIEPMRSIWYGSTPFPSEKKKKAWFSRGSYRYTEDVFTPRMYLYALGMFRTVQIEEGNKNHIAFIEAWKKDYQSILKKYDSNRDGKLDEEEYQNINNQVEIEIIERYKNEADNTEEINILSCEGLPRGKYFMLSRMRQKELIASKKRNAQFASFGFFTFLAHNLYAVAALLF